MGCSPWGHEEVGHDRSTSLSLFTFMPWSRKWQPTPVFLPGESQRREPGGLPSMGRTESDTTDACPTMIKYNLRKCVSATVS